MKKILWAGAAAFLAFAIFSCDATIGPDAGEEKAVVQYTADGRQLVNLNLNINTGGGNRSLTQTLAQSGVDYYEAVFFDGTNYYRTAWHKGETGRILVPAGTYATAAEAILFAGTYSDKTLLATGILSTATSNIGPATTRVEFELTALTSGVTDDGTTSSFLVTGPTTTPSYVTPAVIPKTKIKNYNGMEIPMFKLPKDAAATAKFTVIGLAATGTSVIIGTLSPLESVGVTPEDNPGDQIGIATVNANITSPAAGAAVGTGGVLNIGIAATALPAGKAGALSRIEIALPVTAIADDVPNGITWYIRGGLTNYMMDFGEAVNSIGGSILLAIGSVNSIEIGYTGP